MPFNPTHHRRSIRLRGFDYANAGTYFVTVCTAGRAPLFGRVDAAGRMGLSRLGEIVAEELRRTTVIRPEVRLDEWVVMPNHIHVIVVIQPPDECGDDRGVVAGDDRGVAAGGDRGAAAGATVGATGRSPRRPCGPAKHSLGSFVAGFKSAVTTRINAWRGTPGVPVWQRNYYEHIVRDGADLARIRRYLRLNPARWAWDRNQVLDLHRLPAEDDRAEEQSAGYGAGTSRTSSK